VVVPAGDAGVHQLLLAGAPDGLRAAVRRRVLGPLLAYDAEQHTDLVHTVRVFLECSGSPTRAAKALHVHVNTLRYRIGRAGELLGADLTEFTDQLDVYLALRAGDPA
jgi:DNA-binding PucR family transcriptional regulator